LRVESVSINNFRNIEDLSFNTGSGNVLITGENSQGKTSILEAIYIVSIFKSFRSASKNEIIKTGTESSLIKLKIGNSGTTLSCNALLDRISGLTVKSEKGILKKSDVRNIINVVLFYPGSVSLIEGGPEKRRLFIDSVIVKCEPSFIKILRRYKRAVLQRNALLKKFRTSAKDDMLEVWEGEIASYGSLIVGKRLLYTDDLNSMISTVYSRIFGKEKNIELVYCGFSGKNLSSEEIEKKIRKKLSDTRHNDKIRGFTTSGPHRHEIKIVSAGADMRYFSSRGEQRAGVLSLLESEAQLIKEKRDEYPVFLVDDIASEFDELREKNFISSLIQKNMQVMATATTLSKEYVDIFRGKIIKITGGKCTST